MGFKEKERKIMGFKENVEKPEEKVGTGSTSVREPPKAALKRKK